MTAYFLPTGSLYATETRILIRRPHGKCTEAGDTEGKGALRPIAINFGAEAQLSWRDLTFKPFGQRSRAPQDTL
jgi:hypothetical protein